MAWTLISSLDAPTAGVFDFPSPTLTGYTMLWVVCSGITVTDDDSKVRMQFYVSGSAVTTGYRWAAKGVSSSGVTVDDGDASDPSICLGSDNASWGVGNASTESFSASIFADAPLSTALHKKASFEASIISPAGNSLALSGIGIMENAGAIGGLKIFGSSNLTAGKVRLLGV